MSNRLPTRALVVVVSAVALFTGCGGGNSEQKANEAYASGVCTSIGSWLTEIKSVDTLPSLAGITKASIDAKLNHFEAATRQFVSRIRTVPAPNTLEGRVAKRKIDQSPLIPGAQGEIATARTIASTIATARDMTGVLGALAALPQFLDIQTTSQSTLTFLQSGSGSLASAFRSEPACKQLG